jgi:hypothetical protein
LATRRDISAGFQSTIASKILTALIVEMLVSRMTDARLETTNVLLIVSSTGSPEHP